MTSVVLLLKEFDDPDAKFIVLSLRVLLTATGIFCCSFTFAAGTVFIQQQQLSTDTVVIDFTWLRDMGDILHRIFNKKDGAAQHKTSKKLNISIVPTVGYTLSTGFSVGASSVTTFYTESDHKGNESIINLQAFYDPHSQQTFITQYNIWSVWPRFNRRGIWQL